MPISRLLTLVIGTFFPSAILALTQFNQKLELEARSQPLGSVASAQTPRYVPPLRRQRTQRTRGAGSRGCMGSGPLFLQLLSDSDRVGQTISPHPSFLWYVSATPATSTRFTLVEPGVAQPLWEQQLPATKSAIVQLQMPATAPELEIGKEYRWTVTLICNPLRPSENFYARAWIVRVPPTPTLTTLLAAARSDRDRVDIYARAGIWYDALATAYQAYKVKPLVERDFLALLEQVGLSEIATAERQKLVQQLQFRRVGEGNRLDNRGLP